MTNSSLPAVYSVKGCNDGAAQAEWWYNNENRPGPKPLPHTYMVSWQIAQHCQEVGYFRETGWSVETMGLAREAYHDSYRTAFQRKWEQLNEGTRQIQSGVIRAGENETVEFEIAGRTYTFSRK